MSFSTNQIEARYLITPFHDGKNVEVGQQF